MVRRRVLELVPLELVLACIVAVPLVEVGCILAFVACRLVVLVVEASWVVVACKLASLVVVACILVGLACKMALVEVVLACTLVAVVLACILVVVVVASFVPLVVEVVSWVEVVCRLDALVVVVLDDILALVARILVPLE